METSMNFKRTDMLNVRNNFKMVLLLFFAAATGLMAQTRPVPQQEGPKVEVNDDELAKFAKAYQGIQMVNQEAQKEMIQVVEDKQFEIQRFNEIHQATLDPTKKVEGVTSEEKENYTKVVKEIEGLQPQFQKKMEEAITAQDLTVERYEKLAMALQSDVTLQTRFQKMLQG
ncbi:MAG: DUF4168 domain-containing protein [Sediminicola sp.]